MRNYSRQREAILQTLRSTDTHPTASWIYKDEYLNESEKENNAICVINYYRNLGINDKTIAGILGNMDAESTIEPILNERGRWWSDMV